MSFSRSSDRIIQQWLSAMTAPPVQDSPDDPSYWTSQTKSLITTSQPHRLLLGTGAQILNTSIFHCFPSVQHEILFVTCFWARSPSQAAFAEALRALSARGVSESRRIRVRICFSSCSLWQKLTQTSSLRGNEYPPSCWTTTFGLPGPSELQGLDLTIRSVFVRPFSVMHSKFVVVDRARLFLPSCNVSWEEWFEGCIELSGEVVEQALLFWKNFWDKDGDSIPTMSPKSTPSRPSLTTNQDPDPSVIKPVATLPKPFSQTPLSHLSVPITTILLPSPHHRNPHFRIFPFSFSSPFTLFPLAPIPPPSTPLNTFLLTLLSNASQSIYMLSPNFTSAPVLAALLAALRRGVNVTLVSNRNMMILEQLLTAGQLTEWALNALCRRYRECQNRVPDARSLEAGIGALGRLEIFYYRQLPAASRGVGVEGQAKGPGPTKSHFKLTVVDEEVVVMGSGNMDRASWFTSQELGVAFFSTELSGVVLSRVRKSLERSLERRL